MAHTFKPGDVVQVKSGGPAMTVDELDEGDRVIVEWFEDKKPQRRAYNAAVLQPYTPPPPLTPIKVSR